MDGNGGRQSGTSPPEPVCRSMHAMLRTIALSELIVCWFAWVGVFMRARLTSKGNKAVAKAPAARLGIALQAAAFALALAYFGQMRQDRPAALLIAAMVLAPLAVALAWWATRHLGKQWRLDAALSADHELVRTGPYGLIRHPIYASMLVLHLAVVAAWSHWPLPLFSVPLLLLGIEIRIRAEDRLLAERFGETFTAYRARVPAYLPFVR
jgi:protein-S-isoprenylcysteine O-methyltransferase Ste14